MSLIPGYNFTDKEEVTAAKLLKWIAGGSLDVAIEQAGLDPATGFSMAALTNEGDLAVNFSTGKIYVKTRWGAAPVMGGGFFTKRCGQYISAAYGQLAFYNWYNGLGPHGRGATNFSSIPAQLELTEGITPENSYCYVSHRAEGGTNSHLGQTWVPWPSAELQDAGGDQTMMSNVTTIHPLCCIMGFTPVYATMVTTYTGGRVGGAGTTGALTFRSPTSQQDQLMWAVPNIQGVALQTAAIPDTVRRFWSHVSPYIGCSSTISEWFLNLRI